MKLAKICEPCFVLGKLRLLPFQQRRITLLLTFSLLRAFQPLLTKEEFSYTQKSQRQKLFDVLYTLGLSNNKLETYLVFDQQ